MAPSDLDERGWQVGKPIVECLRRMLEKEVVCDVTFEIQSAGNPHVKVSAHKMILQARSPVFEAMFSGAFVESYQNVIITDIEPTVFKTMLGFMYTDEVNLTGENVVQTLYAANKYILEGLSQKCKDFLNKQISVVNVCSILTHSLGYQDEDLVNTCMDLIAPNAKAVSQTETFYNMSRDALLMVVNCDQLALGVEAELFEGCLEWGRRKVRDPGNPSDEELRELLGECLHHIRFTHIPPQQFARTFGHSRVLNAEEKNLIYSLGLTQEESYNIALASIGFDIASRMLRVKRYVAEPVDKCVIDVSKPSEEVFTCSVNNSIQLIGFSVCGGTAGSVYDIRVTVQNLEKLEELFISENQLFSKGNGKSSPVYIKKMRIAANVRYKVCISVKGSTNAGIGFSMKPAVTVKNITFTFSSIKQPFPKTRGHDVGYVTEILFQLISNSYMSDVTPK